MKKPTLFNQEVVLALVLCPIIGLFAVLLRNKALALEGAGKTDKAAAYNQRVRLLSRIAILGVIPVIIYAILKVSFGMF